MNLRELIPALSECSVEGTPDREVAALRYDSRQVGQGDLFFAWKGASSDGHRFIAEVCRRGASGVVLEQAQSDRPDSATFIRVPDARRALARMAGAFHGHPARALAPVGITGTNGKTTTAFAIKHLLSEPGRPIGLLGTIRHEMGSTILPASRTTPEGSDLQELLAKIKAAGCVGVVMEVSSHALDQGRVEGIEFAVGVFTNLTPDHLDYHKTMEEYFAAKRRLFDGPAPAASAVINIDDPYGARLAAGLHHTGIVITASANSAREASLRAEKVHAAAHGTAFELVFEGHRRAVEIPLIGGFNVANVLGAVGAALALGRDFDQIASRLHDLPAVPGRLERFGGGSQPTVVVDYAHTEDAVRKALETLRELEPQRLLAVVGCGGNRDRTKRPRMAAAALELSDRVYFTADNPRNETISAIFDDMRAGVPADAASQAKAVWIDDRRSAIARAIAEAAPGDIVCIAGKGHEATQEINGVFTPFSDRAVVEEILGGKGRN